ncbi:hypothetical protein Sta7437_2004 [Stanieria cyanosphaera PCC 7437]|uniref:Uncharacterized protein n=1 Tax=Stanieria cyanosphaera (strain ATCC 29371 / PCC 7437) TaxID=111780 RepID=K9XU12_STAC7|nr:right-handed parallel beta-helix repeat-containing protein [Stanieria cyanosphaera]AFZ35556.1 hypothetical protein Sta7437_2004 [Stanieria cyanosphaera PCC 7437]
MNRRIFLTWIWLGFLASSSPRAIASIITQNKHHSDFNSSSNNSKAVVFYVATNGSDRWSGKRKRSNYAKQDGPFATLKRARDAIRELKHQQGGTLQQPVTVLLRGGTYFLSEPLILTPEDSGTADYPITYRAYPNEKPIISGGQPITNWKKQGDLWVANLPKVKQKQWYFRLLRVNEHWAIRARYPNFDPKHPLTGGWLYVDQPESVSEQSLRDRLPLSPDKFPNWQNWEGAEVHIFLKRNYGNAIFPVSDVDRDNHSLLGNFVNTSYPTDFGNRFLIENVREALDSPGEWYLDIKTGELLYWSTEADFPNNVEVVAPIMTKLIMLQGESQTESFVEHLNFQELTFTDTDYTLADYYFVSADAAIWLSATRQCTIENCFFTNLGGNAIWLEQHSHNNQIVSNQMKHLGNGGVVLWGKTENQPFDNLIAANEFEDLGKIYKHTSGVYVISGSGNKIAYNQIKHSSRYGIYLVSLGNDHYSHNNLIEFNEVIDSSLETVDTCAIGTLGRDQQPSNNIIRFNSIRNVVGMGTTTSGEIISPYFSWGFYLDDYSSKITIYGNIVVGTVLGAICLNGGKNNYVENNIFIDGLRMQIRLRTRDEFMTDNIFLRNIIVYKESDAKLWASAGTWRRDIISECDFNLYWQQEDLDIAKIKESITPEGNLNQWQAAGFDLNSLIAEPLFVAPEKDDFRLQSNSPAFKLGFQKIPVEQIGLKGFNSNQGKA